MMKKLTLILLSALLSVGAWAATVNDLVAIDHDWVFVADNITSNGTEGLTANTLYADGKIFTPTGNDKANNRGKSTIEGAEHFNSLRLKLVQDRLAFKVSGPCTAVFYTQNHSERGILISKTDRTSAEAEYWKQQPVSTPRWEVKLDEAGVYYLSNYGGDFYFAGFEVIMDPIAGSQVFGIKRDVAEETTTSHNSITGHSVSDDVLIDPSATGVTIAKNFGTQSIMKDKARSITWQNGTTTVDCYVDKDVKNYRTLIDNTSVTAIDDNCYFGFDMVVEAGYKASLNRLVSDVMKDSYNSHYQVKIYNNGEWVKTLADIEATNTNTDMKRNVDLSQDAALQNMTGTISVKMFVWNTGATKYIIVKDLYVNAVVEELTLTGKEYALKEVKINDVTYDYVTNGTNVTESYASLPSVKFIYSVKKVWSDGVKTDAEDEEEVVTPTLVGDNQVATTTKLTDAVALTFTNIAQFQVVPNAVGTYIDLSSAVVTNCSVENSGANIGSTHNGSTMTINLTNTTAGDYILQFLSGAQDLTATVDINVKGSDYDKTQSFNITNTGAWALSEFHAMALKNLPAGNLTLKLTVTSTTGSYAGNYGNFAVYPISSCTQCDGTNFDLTKGTYAGGARYEADNQNVGYVVNGASAEYTMYNATEGVATLHMGLVHYGDGTVNVTVKDMLTGTTELTTSFVTTTDFCKGYNTPSDIQLGQLTTGLKSIRFDFANESGFICNYKNVNVTIKLPTITLIDAVLKGGTDAPTVTGTYAGSAVAKTQATADANGGYKLGSNGCYVGLTLAEGYTFKAGDVLHVNVTTENGGGSKLALYADQGENLICVSDIYKGTGDLTFTLTEAFNGLTTFYLYRSSDYGWNAYVKSVNVVGVERERVEQTYSVNYSLGESGAQGTVPAAIADENILAKYAAPANQTLYKEGYTLKGWTDGENEYLIGQSYDMAEGEHNLTPVFAANTETLALVKSDIEVTWYFGKKNGAPTYTGAAEVQTKQANLNGETIDLAVLMAGGDNSGRNDEWMNNQQKNMTVPVCAGAVVTAKVYYKNNAVFNGETITYDAEQHGEQGDVVFTYTCPETVGSTIDVNVGNQFLSYIKVTYPAHATISDEMTAVAMEALDDFTGAVTVNRSLTAGMFNTICLPFAMTAAEISAAFGATRQLKKLSSAELTDNVLVLNFDDATTIEAGKPYLIQPAAAVSSWTMENVTLNTTTTPTVGASADFIGVLTPTELIASENTLCVGANSTLFYVGETNTMKGLRAYFQVKGAAAGAPARISLGSHVVTDLENVDVNAKANKLIEQGRVIIRIEGHDYDLNGHLLK